MRDCMKKIGLAIKRNVIELAVILGCLVLLCGFVAAKEGFHMDELLSFELSNAEYNPWIVPTQPEGRLAKFVHNEIDADTPGQTIANLLREIRDVLQNRGGSKLLTYQADVYEEPVWITAEQFSEYITVGERDAFQLLSVYFNVKDDNHPPLHFMLLHLISSVFRGRAEVWMGCAINLAAMALTLWLLIKTGRLLAECLGMPERSRAMGIACALLYGGSAGAVATTLLIRMYGMLTLWCVAYFYLILKKWHKGELGCRNAGLILVTVCGFWTQYFFLFYCLLLAAVVAAVLLRSRRRKELFGFVRAMVIAALLGVALFPFAISDVFSSGRGVEALENLSEGLSGYGTRVSAFAALLADRTFSGWCWCVLLVSAALLPAGNRIRKGREQLASAEQKPLKRGEQKAREGRNDRVAAGCLLLLPALGYFLLAARMAPYMVDRYMMPVFPFVILAGVTLAAGLYGLWERYCPAGWCRGLAGVMCAVVLLLQAGKLWQYDGSYLYSGYREQEAFAQEYADRPCICVYTGVGYYENLKEFTHYRETLLLTWEELQERTDRESIENREEIVVLIKAGVDATEVLSWLTEEYGFAVEKGEWLRKGPYQDTICVMRKDSGLW